MALFTKEPSTRRKFEAPKDIRETARSKVHMTEAGLPYVPAEMFMSCCIIAGRFIKLDGKRQMSTANSTLLPGFLSVEETFFYLVDPRQGGPAEWATATQTAPAQPKHPAEWESDIRRGVSNNAGGSAVAIVRPRFDRWGFTVTCMLDTDQLSEATFRELFDIAGSRVGIGDFRPMRKGIYGRFKVTGWQRMDELKSAS
jgi:hypothetical protein